MSNDNINIELKNVAVLISKLEIPVDFGVDETNLFFGVLNSRISEQRGNSISVKKNEINVWFEESSDAVNFAMDLNFRVSKLNKKNDKPILFTTAIAFGEILVDKNYASGKGIDFTKSLLELTPPNQIYFTKEIKYKIRHRLNVEIENVGNLNIQNIETEIYTINPEVILSNLETSLKKLNFESAKSKIEKSKFADSVKKKILTPIQIISIFILIIAILKLFRVW